MQQLITKTKLLIQKNQYKECEILLSRAMSDYPHSAIPHNLMGILLEHEGNHILAMKHFRASYALEPTYLPARKNMELYGENSLTQRRRCFYSEKELTINE